MGGTSGVLLGDGGRGGPLRQAHRGLVLLAPIEALQGPSRGARLRGTLGIAVVASSSTGRAGSWSW